MSFSFVAFCGSVAASAAPNQAIAAATNRALPILNVATTARDRRFPKIRLGIDTPEADLIFLVYGSRKYTKAEHKRHKKVSCFFGQDWSANKNLLVEILLRSDPSDDFARDVFSGSIRRSEELGRISHAPDFTDNSSDNFGCAGSFACPKLDRLHQPDGFLSCEFPE
jgi:hypothetical protein